MGLRTDLAMEAVEIYEKQEKKDFDGIEIEEKTSGDFRVTVMHVKDENGAKKIDKKMGRYLTIELPGDFYLSPEKEEVLIKIISDSLLSLTGDTHGKTVLAVGLGNRNLTADAIGPKTVDGMLVTRHIDFDGIEKVCAIAPGVMGITGMETGEIVKGVLSSVSCDMVIAIDALAASDTKRVFNTIQMCDCGISPGAGVGNNRKALDKELLGVSVFVIGVPTVVDAYSLVSSLSGEKITSDIENFSVTLKDVDIKVNHISKTLAKGINLALVGVEE